MKPRNALATLLSAVAWLASSASHAQSFTIGVLPVDPSIYQNTGTVTNDSPVRQSFSQGYYFYFPSGNYEKAKATFQYGAGLSINSLDVRDLNSGALVGTAACYVDGCSLTSSLMGKQYFYTVAGSVAANSSSSYSFSAQAIPEPGTYGMFLAGLTSVGWAVRRRRRA